MLLRDSLKTALHGIETNRSRSALTILGIVIGIAAIILIASTGGVAEKAIVGELGGLGAETIVVRSGKEPSGLTSFVDVLFADSLKERELDALRNKINVPQVVAAEPEVFFSSAVSYKSEVFKPTILGLSAEFMVDFFNLELDRGDVFTEDDTRSKSQVVIIGSRVVEELFEEDEDPIGKSITIKDIKFKVIGTFKQKGQVIFFNVDELVLMPHTTVQTYLTGTKHYTQIILKADSPDSISRAVFNVEATLRELHGIEDPDDDDFHIQTQQGTVEQVSSIIGVFTLFLSLVVAISLVVGGIGIMNIMLVSVSERTREIGLRKAVGATTNDIRLQFLLEAAFLTLAGGVIGIIIGTLLAYGATFGATIALDLDLSFSFPWFASFLGLISSFLVGIIFGLYPAIQAAKKSPIEALRYE
jgi:putative ABC transport system permease protein